MKITSAKFITSQVEYKPFCDMPEVALAGRSNVGKSSLINMLTGNGKLARTSDTPGRTRLINFFEINNDFLFVDLPGYGYAKGAKFEKEKWGRMLEDYFSSSQHLALAVMLVDIRHEPSELDKIMLRYLYAHGLPFLVVATKADKLSRARQGVAVQTISAHLKIPVANIFVTSASQKKGADELISKIYSVLQATDD